MRVAVRFVASVLLVSGVLLLADAAITLAWQEPLSALLAKREQAKLEEQLEARVVVVRRDLLELSRRRPSEQVVRGLARRERRRLRRGDAVGRIDLPALGRRYTMVHGTDTATLRKGPAHFPETPLPGEGGTVGVAGHRTTYGAPFRTIDRLRRGHRIVLTMPYGRFTYRVERTRIVPPTAVWVTKPVGYERVVLTACHPLYSAAKRIVVFGRLVKAEPLAPPPVSSVDSSRDSRNSSRP
jgi:sortase A